MLLEHLYCLYKKPVLTQDCSDMETILIILLASKNVITRSRNDFYILHSSIFWQTIKEIYNLRLKSI